MQLHIVTEISVVRTTLISVHQAPPRRRVSKIRRHSGIVEIKFKSTLSDHVDLLVDFAAVRETHCGAARARTLRAEEPTVRPPDGFFLYACMYCAPESSLFLSVLGSGTAGSRVWERIVVLSGIQGLAWIPGRPRGARPRRGKRGPGCGRL